MTRVVLASGNAGKLAELSTVLDPLGFELLSQATLGVSEVPETGSTFVENALIKARNASEVTGLAAIADDSGIVVPALGGAPGIFSARYAGEQASDTDNNNKLIADINALGHDAGARTAYFYCCLVFLEHAGDPTPTIASAAWHGRITDTPRGQNGFGYDPHFLVGDTDRTSAELAPEAKNAISHRGQAASRLVVDLTERLAHGRQQTIG